MTTLLLIFFLSGEERVVVEWLDMGVEGNLKEERVTWRVGERQLGIINVAMSSKTSRPDQRSDRTGFGPDQPINILPMFAGQFGLPKARHTGQAGLIFFFSAF